MSQEYGYVIICANTYDNLYQYFINELLSRDTRTNIQSFREAAINLTYTNACAVRGCDAKCLRMFILFP
jgi:hypothetical protein